MGKVLTEIDSSDTIPRMEKVTCYKCPGVFCENTQRESRVMCVTSGGACIGEFSGSINDCGLRASLPNELQEKLQHVLFAAGRSLVALNLPSK